MSTLFTVIRSSKDKLPGIAKSFQIRDRQRNWETNEIFNRIQTFKWFSARNYLSIKGTKCSRMDQVKFGERLSCTNFTWSILDYFVPNYIVQETQTAVDILQNMVRYFLVMK